VIVLMCKYDVWFLLRLEAVNIALLYFTCNHEVVRGSYTVPVRDI
jgi:hypothetical protein